MTIDDFLYVCYDEGLLTVEIYSGEAEKVVWVGPGDEIPDEYRYAELSSFDIPSKADHMTLNID